MVYPDIYQCDPRGFTIVAAYLTGTLNLDNLKIELKLAFLRCLFDSAPFLLGARTRTLNFHACRLPGLSADGLQVDGGLFLRHSVFENEVRIPSAVVTGDVVCSHATFRAQTHDHDSFTAHSLSCGCSIFLDNIKSSGSIVLSGASVAGDLDCDGATLSARNTYAFNAERIVVKGCLYWRDMKTPPHGDVSLIHATVGALGDDIHSWPQDGGLWIDGLVYENIRLDTSAVSRCKWLKLMPNTWHDGDPAYWAQPYEQLNKVLTAAGHERDARDIAIAKQDAYRVYLKRKAEFDNVATWHRRLWLLILKYSAGYGYETWRAGVFVLIFVAYAWIVFERAYHEGHMAPAKERIYTQSCYTKNVECDKWRTDIKLKWTYKTLNLPEDYPQFTPLTYAIDTLIPFVDLHQESYWLPTHLGYKIYLWVHIIFGWVLATIAVAGFTGLIKKD